MPDGGAPRWPSPLWRPGWAGEVTGAEPGGHVHPPRGRQRRELLPQLPRRPVTDVGFGHEQFAIYVWRSVREGGDTKTEKSRRTLKLPDQAAAALRKLHTRQTAERAAAAAEWRDHGLVFCTRVGTPLAAGNVRRSLRSITRAAGIGEDWTPRELRHSFVSIMSDNGVSIESIADLVGHKNSTVTARVYRHQLRPVITQGAEAMDAIFSKGRDVEHS